MQTLPSGARKCLVDELAFKPAVFGHNTYSFYLASLSWSAGRCVIVMADETRLCEPVCAHMKEICRVSYGDPPDKAREDTLTKCKRMKTQEELQFGNNYPCINPDFESNRGEELLISSDYLA